MKRHINQQFGFWVGLQEGQHQTKCWKSFGHPMVVPVVQLEYRNQCLYMDRGGATDLFLFGTGTCC